ncbi:MAG: DUF5666 domain-containing protein [bacterium]|nr:DUF5666 domain-containing protein [bacterium]
MKQSQIVSIILGFIIIGGVAFFGGMKYQESKTTTNQSQAGTFGNGQGMMRNNGQFGNRTGGQTGSRATTGDIVATSDNSITVKMQDGSSKIVLYSPNTPINKSDKATSTDLKTGERIAVFGTDNSDGSVTAQDIQLNPMMRINPSQSPTPSK